MGLLARRGRRGGGIRRPAMSEPNALTPERVNEINAFLHELEIETNRGAALLGAAMIDDSLRGIIAAYLIDRKTIVDELLTNANAPLQAFSARSKLVYCLGLISRAEYFNIDTIRDIRNKFAHKVHGLSFGDKKVADLCRKLKYHKSTEGIINIPTPRHAFMLATAIIVANLEQVKVSHRPLKKEHDDWEPMRPLKW
jgi:mannitol operon repressor